MKVSFGIFMLACWLGIALSLVPSCASYTSQGLELADCVRAEVDAPCAQGQEFCGEDVVIWVDGFAHLYQDDRYQVSLSVKSNECLYTWVEERE